MLRIHLFSTMIFNQRRILLIFVFLILAIFCSRCTAQKFDEALPRGISGIFLKKVELMTRNSWSSKPLDVPAGISKLSRYDAIWGAHLLTQHNLPVWRFLRRNRPNQLMLYYCHANTTKADGENPYFDYEFISKHHPELFLLKDSRNATPRDYKDKNKRIRWHSDPKSPYYNRFFIDIADADFQDWAVGQILDMVSGKKQRLTHAYDGLAMDNVAIGLRRWGSLNKSYPNWKYRGDPEAWNISFFAFLKKIKKALNDHGFILVVNHSMDYSSDNLQRYWEAFYDCVDGIFTERELRWNASSGPYYTGKKWSAAIKRHEYILEKGLINWWWSRPAKSGPRSHDEFLYTYCSWLLINKPGVSFYSATRGDRAWLSPNVAWYEEYELPIGEPVGRRYPLGQCWARKYKNAIILVNPNDRAQLIVVDEGKQWLDWTSKQAVRNILLSSQSGRILLPISDKANSNTSTVGLQLWQYSTD